MLTGSGAIQLMTMFKFSAAIYIMNKTHVLNNLIVLEYLAAAITIWMFNMLYWLTMEFHMALYILILFITESIVGLSALIKMIRTHSNDYLKLSSTSLM